MSKLDTYEGKYHVAGVCEVARVAPLTLHMQRITFHCEALTALEPYWRPDMLAQLYFPPKGSSKPAERIRLYIKLYPNPRYLPARQLPLPCRRS
jgi:NADPH-dependent ferric siderophore reductase